MSSSNGIPHTPFVPFDPYVSTYGTFLGHIQPLEFTGWQDEVLSWKKNAYLHGGLNPTATFRITGPDALRLFSEHCVNSVAKFPIGAAKHAVMCNDDGLIEAHGVLVRQGEDDFITYWLAPWLPQIVASGQYDVQMEDLTGQFFLYQIAGPRSLEILEALTGDDLRDIKFLRQRKSTIEGIGIDIALPEINVLRLGMAGSLAYEVHGPAEHALAVYNAIRKAGEPFGLRRLGAWQYQMNHTENGFPQSGLHFLHPCWTHGSNWKIAGSAGTDVALSYRNPVELGWSHVIKFDHEFQGRAALEREVANPRRKMVTLVWNPDDLLDIYRSYFEPGEPYPFMEFTREPQLRESPDLIGPLIQDAVLKDGKSVGISSSRIYSYYYRQMISLCSIDAAEAELGNEVVILRGDPGTRQKEIRARVERFPFYNEDRNETVDVTARA